MVSGLDMKQRNVEDGGRKRVYKSMGGVTNTDTRIVERRGNDLRVSLSHEEYKGELVWRATHPIRDV